MKAITGLKVNLEKSTIISLGADDKIQDLANILHCKVETLPFKYLGMPLGASRKQTSILEGVLEKFKSKLALWRKRFLSKAARIELINSALSSLPIYFMSLIQMPVSIEKQMSKHMRDFLWGSSQEKKKINWIARERACKTKNMGGLGIRNLKATNKSLLSKWIWRYYQEKEALWRKIIQHKTATEKDDLIPKECKDSYGTGFWKGIDNEKGIVHWNMELKIGDGKATKFWLDPLKSQVAFYKTHQKAFKAATKKDAKIAELVHNGQWNLQLKQNPSEAVMGELDNIISIIGDPPNLVPLSDSISYNTAQIYISKEGYKWLMQQQHNGEEDEYKHVWNKKVPPKAQMLVWLAIQNAFPTMDNLNKRGCEFSNTLCCLCNAVNEDVNHVFLNCNFAKQIWIKLENPLDKTWSHKTDIQNQFLDWHSSSCKGLAKKVWPIIPFAICWAIWGERNRRVMANKRSRVVETVVIEVKLLVFQWG